MKERTMNGIPIREVWKMLAAEFPPQDIQRHPSTHKEYVPVEKIEERLNAVVGMENWNFYTDQPQICRLGSDDYESCVVSGRLVLYDDDRVPIVRSTCGASDVIYPKDSKRPTSVANALDSAVQDVFKRCAKRFGIAKKKNADHVNRGKPQTNAEKLMKVTFLEPFRALPQGGAKERVSYDGQTLEMVIWIRQWEMLQKKFGDRFKIGGKLNEITFLGVEKVYRGTKQLEFIRFSDSGGNGKGAA